MHDSENRPETPEVLTKLIRSWNKGFLTGVEAQLILLRLIDEHGAGPILDFCPEGLLNLAEDWLAESPKSREEWAKQRLLEMREGIGGISEAVWVPLEAREIESRLQMVENLTNYFQTHRSM